MNSRLRPSRSDILPNTSAPTISPTRYTDAISPTSVEVMPSVEDLVSSPDTELATVICNPSRTHAPPRPQTSRVWNGDQFSRSRRAGIRLRIGRGAASVVVIESSLSQTGRFPLLGWSRGLRSQRGGVLRPGGSRRGGHEVTRRGPAPGD